MKDGVVTERVACRDRCLKDQCLTQAECKQLLLCNRNTHMLLLLLLLMAHLEPRVLQQLPRRPALCGVHHNHVRHHVLG